MNHVSPAERLARDLDELSAAAMMLPTETWHVEDLVSEAIYLLDCAYGAGNRHSVAVRDMIDTAKEETAGDSLNPDFLPFVARRLRGLHH